MQLVILKAKIDYKLPNIQPLQQQRPSYERSTDFHALQSQSMELQFYKKAFI